MTPSSAKRRQNGELALHNSGDAPLFVPKVGYRMDTELNSGQRFAYGFMDPIVREEVGEEGLYRIKVRDPLNEYLVPAEIEMLRIMDAMTDKPRWQDKIYYKEVIQNWKMEALRNSLVTKEAFDWCLQEVRDKIPLHAQYVVTLDSQSRCVKADKVVPKDLRKDLQEYVRTSFNQDQGRALRSIGQVFDLIDPSLYPLVNGRTHVLGDGLDKPYFSKKNPTFWSKQFQWLPCEVEFADAGNDAIKVTSYINNLHPLHHAKLYTMIEKLIGYSIPAWNEVISKSSGGRTPPRITTRKDEGRSINYPPLLQDFLRYHQGYIPDEIRQQAKDFMSLPDAPPHLSMKYQSSLDLDNIDIGVCDEWLLRKALYEKRRRIERRVCPTPQDTHSYEDWTRGDIQRESTRGTLVMTPHTFYDVDLARDFHWRGLQVIVRMTSIELTPENPSYTGGSWHLDGILNEHIAATSVFYFDSENVTKSRISFRHEAGTGGEVRDVDQDVEGYCRLYDDIYVPISDARFDYVQEASCGYHYTYQELGSVATPEGRLLAWPQTMQHRIEPFELLDKSRPGHQRFLTLHLVDPYYQIVSTRNVMAQQRDWWTDTAADILRPDSETSRIWSALGMPTEVRLMVGCHINQKSYTMTPEEAEAYRVKLVAEREEMNEVLEDRMRY